MRLFNAGTISSVFLAAALAWGCSEDPPHIKEKKQLLEALSDSVETLERECYHVVEDSYTPEKPRRRGLKRNLDKEIEYQKELIEYYNAVMMRCTGPPRGVWRS